MMDGIGDLELRHGARRASAYARAEPIIRCLEATIHRHRAATGQLDDFPATRVLVAACRDHGLIAPRGGAITEDTVRRTLRLMGLRQDRSTFHSGRVGSGSRGGVVRGARVTQSAES